MKCILKSLFSILFAFLSNSIAAQTPAFPSAEGFGMFTTGGRGGEVIHVTTLEDGTQKGTFRYACNQNKKRTIVFDVSGTIHLTSELKLSKDNVTIAGQSAPGDGICIADYPFVVSANNVIIRFLRFRLGNKALKDNASAHEGDGLGGMDKKNVIIDHCSVSWSIDECLSVYGMENLTVQWCIASQSLRASGHSKGNHGYGGNWGGAGASYHHNLLVHHDSRTPRLGPRPSTQTREQMDMRNNVIYNWCGNGCYGGEGMKVNIVNNYYKPGPGTAKRSTTIQQRIASINIRTSEYTKHDTSSPNQWDVMWHVWGKYYVNGNVNSKYNSVTNDNWTYGMYNQIDANGNDGTYTQATKDTMRVNLPIHFQSVTTHSAEQAYERVLAYAGASLHRDWLDELMVSDTRNGVASYTGNASGDCPGIIDSQEDNRPANAPADWQAWPTLTSLPTPNDTDQDGMPDEWEEANGLNKNNASDGQAITSDGYSNLEHYLNSLVADITEAQLMGGIQLSNQDIYSDETDIKQLESYNISSPFIYDLCGCRYSSMPTHKGLYIKEGRKVIVR